MNELELFAGLGGGILAAQLLGHRTVCAVESNPYRIRRLMQRQNEGHLPPFPIWDDVRTFDGYPWRGIVDCISGGFPCQAYSSAARGRNVADDLWPEMRRIVADVAPRYVRAENTQRRAIDRAADDLESMGYTVRCIALSAADVGADHIRMRYWLFAHADDDRELRLQVDAEVAQLSRVRPGVWDAYPDESRMADGLANRMERLEATGDGQVPIVAAAAFRILAYRLAPHHLEN
ncbi:DNA (cytosine-5)-methyltransferase 1 [Paraburkholderia sp. GAS33]|uniref:DNA cytosine methyltransferase n=1 Tax=Paraburkholderia sp. GAS33 TaxID=3035130 RepID=UPI003D227889